MPRISPQARRALQDERRAQILNAAAKVFARRGYERATITEIAKAAGMAEGSIYNYFKNKGDLLVSIPRQTIASPEQPLYAALMRAAQQDPRAAAHAPQQVLAAIAQQALNLSVEHADLMRVVFATLPTMNRATRKKYLEQVPFFTFDHIEAYLRAQVAAGVLRADLNPAVAARAFAGMVLAYIVLRVVLQYDEDTVSDERIVAEVVQIFLNGTCAPKRATARATRTQRKATRGRRQKG